MCKTRKILLITGLLCAMSTGAAGCGRMKEADSTAIDAEKIAQDEEEQAENTGEMPGDKEAENLQELYGDILEIGDRQFTVSEITLTKTKEGGGEAEVMVSTAPENDEMINKITVAYDENTVFTKQTIWDGGARYEETEAASADLQKDLTAEMKGSYEGEVFHADEIRIVEVVL